MPLSPGELQPSGDTTGSAVAQIAGLGGAALSVATRAVAAVRPAARPLHPRGALRRGRLLRDGLAEATGCSWLDEPGLDSVVARFSRSLGLPRPAPDIDGLALSIGHGPARGDLLLASTGWGPLSRLVLLPRTRSEGHLTTLLPYRTVSGAVTLGLAPQSDGSYGLSVARPFGPWQRFGRLELGDAVADGDIDDQGGRSFDPVRWQLPGLAQYPAVVRLREPAYATARSSRR